MMLLLSSWRRLVVQDRMVRDGRWAEGRPALNQPRLMGQTLGFIAFGHVARAIAMRARPFGFRMLAYDPYVEELVMSPYGVEPVTLEEVLRTSDSSRCTRRRPSRCQAHAHREALPDDEAERASSSTPGEGATVDEAALIKALQQGWIAGAGPRRARGRAAEAGQSAAQDGQRDPDRARGVRVRAVRSRARRRVGQEIALVARGYWPRACVNPSVLEKTELKRWQPYSMERGPAT